MATRDEIVDQIAGFALFADLTTPQLQRVAHTFEERGLPGGRADPPPGPVGVGVPRHPRRRGGGRRSTASSGRRSAGATSSARSRSCSASRRSPTSSPLRPLRCLVLAGPQVQAVPARQPAGDVPDAPGPGAPAAEREPVAELAGRRRRRRPAVPAGRLSARRRRAAARAGSRSRTAAAGSASSTPCSRPTTRPGGMFRRWPFFQRLLSWTKPFAPVDAAVAAYERYDWNSLLADEPEHRAIMPDLMDGTSYFPSRPGDGGEPRGVRRADRHPGPVRLPLDGDAPRGGRRRRDFVLETTDGEYRAPVARLRRRRRRAVLAADAGDRARRPLRRHAAGRDLRRQADLHHRQAELGLRARVRLLPWARRIVLASPSPAKLSVNTRSLVGVRARYVQPFEDHVLGGGVAVLDAVDRGHRALGRTAASRSRARPTDGGAELADRGRRGHRRDRLRDAAPRPARPRRRDVRPEPAAGPDAVLGERVACPASSSRGRSRRAPAGLKKHGLPANSGAVHGARYNARCLARTSPGRGSGSTGRAADDRAGRPLDAVARRAGHALRSSGTSGPTWPGSSRSTPRPGIRDEGIVPLAASSTAQGDDGRATRSR